MTKAIGKTRITITLRKDILPLLDHFVDGDKIRNRSHAIEYILGQHLGLGIEKAVIFAGSDKKHKTTHALTRVKNRPVIAYIFDMLKANGIRNLILVIDAQGKQLKEYIGDGQQWGMHVQYVEDKTSQGTAHLLTLIRPFIQQRFLLIYSDVLADIPLADFVEFHQQVGTVGTVALTYSRASEEYGVARMQGNKIMEYSEKPGKEGKHGLINAGMYLFEPDIFEYLGKDSLSLEKEMLPTVAENGQLAGYPFHGKWFDISKDESHKKAEKEWR